MIFYLFWTILTHPNTSTHTFMIVLLCSATSSRKLSGHYWVVQTGWTRATYLIERWVTKCLLTTAFSSSFVIQTQIEQGDAYRMELKLPVPPIPHPTPYPVHCIPEGVHTPVMEPVSSHHLSNEDTHLSSIMDQEALIRCGQTRSHFGRATLGDMSVELCCRILSFLSYNEIISCAMVGRAFTPVPSSYEPFVN